MCFLPPRLVWILPLVGFCACNRDDPRVQVQVAASSTPSVIAPIDMPEVLPPESTFTPPVDEPRIAMPGPQRKRGATAALHNAACASCHDKQAKEWRGSYHQRANIDPAYVKAFAIEPSPFCRSCHAPEADPAKEPPIAVSELGVGCVTCHVTEEGFVLAADHGDGAAHEPAPHPVRRSKAFAHQAGCADCHEFRFPMPGGDDDAFFMQTTAREHLRSPAAAKACADCHMPVELGQRSHAFAHVRDPAWLRKNLLANAERIDDTLHVKLVQPNPGHDAPTGDLFRRYEVGWELVNEKGDVLQRETQYLARHFEAFSDRPGRRLTRDNRVGADPAIVTFELPREAPASARIKWWLTYQRVATVGMGQNPADAVIESEIKLHSGEIPWHDNPSPMNRP